MWKGRLESKQESLKGYLVSLPAIPKEAAPLWLFQKGSGTPSWITQLCSLASTLSWFSTTCVCLQGYGAGPPSQGHMFRAHCSNEFAGLHPGPVCEQRHELAWGWEHNNVPLPTNSPWHLSPKPTQRRRASFSFSEARAGEHFFYKDWTKGHQEWDNLPWDSTNTQEDTSLGILRLQWPQRDGEEALGQIRPFATCVCMRVHTAFQETYLNFHFSKKVFASTCPH